MAMFASLCWTSATSLAYSTNNGKSNQSEWMLWAQDFSWHSEMTGEKKTAECVSS